MKRMLVTGLLVITATSDATGQMKNSSIPANSDVGQEIRQVEVKRRKALLQSDTTALEQIFADDYMITNQFGQVQTKAQMISDLKSGALKFESIDEDDVIIRTYGDAAVVTGRTTSKHKGRQSMQVRFTRVYVKRQGRWQTVAYQTTRIVQQ